MLIDKYLSTYDFKEFHSVELNSSHNGVYQKLLHCDFSKSSVIKFLFRLRGMRKELCTIEHLTKMGFIKLDEVPGNEILFGMITDSPIFNRCQSHISPPDFTNQSNPSIIKAVINFHVNERGSSKYIISTETRIWCGSKVLKSKFKRYWFWVKPFSQLIRKSILKQIKKQVSEASNHSQK